MRRTAAPFTRVPAQISDGKRKLFGKSLLVVQIPHWTMLRSRHPALLLQLRSTFLLDPCQLVRPRGSDSPTRL